MELSQVLDLKKEIASGVVHKGILLKQMSTRFLLPGRGDIVLLSNPVFLEDGLGFSFFKLHRDGQISLVYAHDLDHHTKPAGCCAMRSRLLILYSSLVIWLLTSATII